ncbi:hypothetical protein JXB31_03130 [Candidatus Woesearchaeota archaeon]|nr:hypothetical protein [Candidatus Woesearchaeota archaeon]
MPNKFGNVLEHNPKLPPQKRRCSHWSIKLQYDKKNPKLKTQNPKPHIKDGAGRI